MLNPVNYIGHNQGAAFLFQGMKNIPEKLSEANFRAYFEAAPEPKTLRWYEVESNMNMQWAERAGYGVSNADPSVPSFVDHRAWLQENV